MSSTDKYRFCGLCAASDAVKQKERTTAARDELRIRSLHSDYVFSSRKVRRALLIFSPGTKKQNPSFTKLLLPPVECGVSRRSQLPDWPQRRRACKQQCRLCSVQTSRCSS